MHQHPRKRDIFKAKPPCTLSQLKTNLHPCSAATLNSSSGIESANSFASWASLTPSKGLAECWQAAMCSSTGGGRYARFFEPNASEPVTDSGGDCEFLVEDARDEDDEENDGDMDHRVEELNDGDRGAGVEGSSMPSRSPSMGSSSLSVDGKKFRKRASACHLEAFLNSIQTSIRPGRESAGSRRSR